MIKLKECEKYVAAQFIHLPFIELCFTVLVWALAIKGSTEFSLFIGMAWTAYVVYRLSLFILSRFGFVFAEYVDPLRRIKKMDSEFDIWCFTNEQTGNYYEEIVHIKDLNRFQWAAMKVGLFNSRVIPTFKEVPVEKICHCTDHQCKYYGTSGSYGICTNEQKLKKLQESFIQNLYVESCDLFERKEESKDESSES